MPKFKIAYVNGTAFIGGAEVSLLNLVKKLNRDLFEPLVVLPSEGPLADKLKRMKVNIRTTKLMEFSKQRWFPFGLATFRLASLIKKEKIDLVHANSIYIAEESFFAAKLARMPCICHVRDLIPILGAGGVRMQAFREMNKMIAVSDAVKRDLIGKLNIPVNKVMRIYNGVDLQEFHLGISGRAFRQEFNLGHKKLIGMIGRLSPEKGHEIFLRAGARILKHREDARLIIVGSSELGSNNYREKLKGLVKALGIEDRVIFTGFRDDLPQVMASLDMVAVLSIAEPFGRVIVEAMAMAKPVIAANSGAAPELISNEDGFLIEPGNIGELESTITYLLENESRAKELGEKGRENAAKRFNIEQNVSETERLYGEILRFRL